MVDVAPLAAERLGRRYRRRRPWALQDLDLTITEGSITALVGPNGAGKSTLIRSWLGFERPDAGRVLVRGVDPQRDRARALSSLGYVPQSTSLYRSLTSDDHFTMASIYRDAFDRDYALRRLGDVGIDPDRPIKELSGGEQAQVSLAIALGTRSSILLLDEPLANLDPLARRDFLAALVQQVHETGGTVVLSSHIVTDVEQACDWIVVLSHGRLVLNSSIESARTHHRTIPAAEVDGGGAIGTFVGPDGIQLALVAGAAAGSGSPPASLEEIVLGHLAGARARAVAR